MAQSIHAHTFYRANPFCTCTTALISQSVKTLFDKPVQCVRNLQGDRGVATTAPLVAAPGAASPCCTAGTTAATAAAAAAAAAAHATTSFLSFYC